MMMMSKQNRKVIVFSGGTALNSCAKQMLLSLKHQTDEVTHVLPVSDDGGSTAEIVRVLGGPAVGDIRSRCLRLSSDKTKESRSVNALLGHRLSAHSAEEAKQEWYQVVEGDHPLWLGISEAYKNTIRAFLVHFQQNILRRNDARFDFTNGSIGNYFFAGARIFFRSLEAAIFLYSRVSGIPETCAVLPTQHGGQVVLRASSRTGRHRGLGARISHPLSLPLSAGAAKWTRTRGPGPLESRISGVFYLSPRRDARARDRDEAARGSWRSSGRPAWCTAWEACTSLCPLACARWGGEGVAALGREVKKVWGRRRSVSQRV